MSERESISIPVLPARSVMNLLGGSWVDRTGVIIRVTILIRYITYRGLITLLITTHEPPSIP